MAKYALVYRSRSLQCCVTPDILSCNGCITIWCPSLIAIDDPNTIYYWRHSTGMELARPAVEPALTEWMCRLLSPLIQTFFNNKRKLSRDNGLYSVTYSQGELIEQHFWAKMELSQVKVVSGQFGKWALLFVWIFLISKSKHILQSLFREGWVISPCSPAQEGQRISRQTSPTTPFGVMCVQLSLMGIWPL